MFLVFVLLCEFIICPTKQLCDKIYSSHEFGVLPSIEYGLSTRLTMELRKLSYNL